MKIFNGRKAARQIMDETAAKIKNEKIHPALAVILVGEDAASKLYIKLKREAAAKVGIKVQECLFAADTKEEEIISKIKALNEDKKVHGILVQMPLPAALSPDRVIAAIDSKKDVDGFKKENRRFFLAHGKTKPRLGPVLPKVILFVLNKALKNDLKNKKMIALVNSSVFAQSLKEVLEKEGVQINCLVRKACVIMGVEKEVKEADVLITVCGCPRFIKGDMIKNGAILIDAGITRYSDGKVVGDVDRESVKTKADFLTPVPGGIGPLTVALLFHNVYLAAGNLSGKHLVVK